MRQWRAKNRERVNARSAEWAVVNAEKVKETSRRKYQKNRERLLAGSAAWKKAHPEAAARAWARYCKKHPGAAAIRRRRDAAKRNAYGQFRRAQRRLACPVWSRNDPRVLALYEITHWLRALGEAVDVDHLFPLRPRGADEAQGLHVYSNLRIVGSRDNYRKGRRPPTQEEVAELRFRDTAVV